MGEYYAQKFLDAGYTFQNAEQLAAFWDLDGFYEAKVRGGEMIEQGWGAGGLAPTVEAASTGQWPDPRTISFIWQMDGWPDHERRYADIDAVANYWNVSIDEMKANLGEKLQMWLNFRQQVVAAKGLQGG